MHRRNDLLTIGQLFEDTDALRNALGKNTNTDMAICLYAVNTDQLDKIAPFFDYEELLRDIKHIDKHFKLKIKKQELMEDYRARI